MLRRHGSIGAVCLALALFCGALTHSLGAREPLGAAVTPGAPQAPAGAASFTGPGSCAAAACHGAVRPVPGSRILQTEYSTWIAQDRHARATEVLSNAVSGRMAKTLGLGQASTAPQCLACHSIDAPEGRLARTFAQEGVSCEACHGPASGWLGPHTTRGWTHEQSVQAGMYDTKDLVKRTERCLTCHLGTADKEVDHRMIAAGHPDLVFDLEAFGAAMPRHWRATTEADPFATVRSFSVGQLVHLRSSLERLARRVKSPAWPEYGELDCFSCHHSLTRPEDSWRQAQGYDDRRPGNPPLNLARWTTARHVLATVDSASATELAEIMQALAREGSRLQVKPDEVVALTVRARASLDRGIAKALATQPDAAMATRLLRALTSDADALSRHGERAAEQAAMAMETLYTASARGTQSPSVRSAFDEMFGQFQSPSSYEPARFVAHVRKLEAAIR